MVTHLSEIVGSDELNISRFLLAVTAAIVLGACATMDQSSQNAVSTDERSTDFQGTFLCRGNSCSCTRISEDDSGQDGTRTIVSNQCHCKIRFVYSVKGQKGKCYGPITRPLNIGQSLKVDTEFCSHPYESNCF